MAQSWPQVETSGFPASRSVRLDGTPQDGVPDREPARATPQVLQSLLNRRTHPAASRLTLGSIQTTGSPGAGWADALTDFSGVGTSGRATPDSDFDENL